MTVYTLRPSADVSQGNTSITGTPSPLTRYRAMADNDNTTWVQHIFAAGAVSYTRSNLDDLSALSTGETIARVRVRLLYDPTGGGSTDFYAVLYSGSASCPPDYYTAAFSGQTAFIGPWKTVAPDGGAWTAAKVNALDLVLQDNGGGTNKPQVVEAYVDVETNYLPTTTVSVPTGTVTDTAMPTVVASYADTESDPQDAYQIKVFSAAQYGAGGFDPATSTPVWDSGVVPSAVAVSVPVGTALVNGTTYRAYVALRQAGSVISQWSAWAYSQFTLSLTVPVTPALSVVNDDTNAKVTATVTAKDNLLDAESSDFETTIGTWAGVTNCTIARSTAQAANGTASLAMTATSAAQMQTATPTGASGFACTPGSAYRASAQVRAASAARSVTLTAYWYKSDGTASATPTTTVATATDSTSAWATLAANVTAPADAAFCRLLVSVASPGASEVHYVDTAGIMPGSGSSWNRGITTGSTRTFELQRSTDSGTSWTTVARFPVLSSYAFTSSEQSLAVTDYEAPRGVAVIYQARVKVTLPSGAVIPSPWVAASSITQAVKGWWLKSTTDPTKNMQPNMSGEDWALKSTEREGVFYGLGRRTAIVISDAIGGEQGTLQMGFVDDASYQAFETLRSLRQVMLLQSPYGHHLYVRLGADRQATFTLNPSGVPKRIVTVPFYEVDAA